MSPPPYRAGQLPGRVGEMVSSPARRLPGRAPGRVPGVGQTGAAEGSGSGLLRREGGTVNETSSCRSPSRCGRRSIISEFVFIFVPLAFFAALFSPIYESFEFQKAYRLAMATEDISLAYVKRVFPPGTVRDAGWGGVLAGLATGVAVPPGSKLASELDRWVKKGILVTTELNFSRPVPADPRVVRSAYAYRLRYTEAGPVRCPVDSFPESIPIGEALSVRGWSLLRFYGERVRVGGVRLSYKPFARAVDSRRPPRQALERLFWSAREGKYVEGKPRCYLTSGSDALRSAYEWTAFLFDEGVIHNDVMPDGRPAILKRPDVEG